MQYYTPPKPIRHALPYDEDIRRGEPAAPPSFLADRGGVLGKPSPTPAQQPYASHNKPTQPVHENRRGILAFRAHEPHNAAFTSNFPRWKPTNVGPPYYAM